MMQTKSRGLLLSINAVFFSIILSLYFIYRPKQDIATSLLTINLVLACFFYLGSHVIRMLRLYVLAIEEKGLFSEIFQLYFYLLFISFPFPFKLGEVTRIIGLNNFFQSRVKGGLIVLLERFSDSIVLLIFMLALFSVNSEYFYTLKGLFFLLIFLVCSLVFIYLLLKTTVDYFERHAIEKIHSSSALKILEICLYQRKLIEYIASCMRGRFLLVFFLTFLIWMLELATVYYLINQVMGQQFLTTDPVRVLLEYIQGKPVDSQIYLKINTLFDRVVYYSIFIISGGIFLSYLPKKNNAINKSIASCHHDKNKYSLKNNYIRQEE